MASVKQSCLSASAGQDDPLLSSMAWGWEGIALKASSYKQLRTKKFQFPSRFPLLKFSCKDEELWISWLSLGYRKKPLEMILLPSPKRM